MLASSSLNYKELSPADPPRDGGAERKFPFGNVPQQAEDLNYRVELWDVAKERIEAVLAVTASANIGVAAFYAAAREWPDRIITLRHKGEILNRWNGPTH